MAGETDNAHSSGHPFLQLVALSKICPTDGQTANEEELANIV